MNLKTIHHYRLELLLVKIDRRKKELGRMYVSYVHRSKEEFTYYSERDRKLNELYDEADMIASKILEAKTTTRT